VRFRILFRYVNLTVGFEVYFKAHTLTRVTPLLLAGDIFLLRVSAQLRLTLLLKIKARLLGLALARCFRKMDWLCLPGRRALLMALGGNILRIYLHQDSLMLNFLIWRPTNVLRVDPLLHAL